MLAFPMTVMTTVLSLPVTNLETTARFYRDGLGFADARVEEGGIIALELANLSLFLIERGEFDVFSRKVERETRMPPSRRKTVPPGPPAPFDVTKVSPASEMTMAA